MRGEKWTEHEDNTRSDIEFAWTVWNERTPSPVSSVKAGLLMLQSIARSLAVLADEAEERRQR